MSTYSVGPLRVVRPSGALGLIFSCKPFMHPQEFLALVQYTEEAFPENQMVGLYHLPI